LLSTFKQTALYENGKKFYTRCKGVPRRDPRRGKP
jgi:hypothetical protein